MKTLVRTDIVLCVLLTFPILAFAQKSDFSFYPISGIQPKHQHFLGKAGTHFFMSDPGAGNGLHLFIYDTLSRTSVSRSYDFPSFAKMVVEEQNSISFMSILQNLDTAALHVLELNERGDAIGAKKVLMNVWRSPISFISSVDKKRIMIYQLRRRGEDTAMVRAHLFDQQGNLQRDMLYSFRFDPEKHAEPELFLDITGNVHILVYDKSGGYKLSSELSVNTISFASEEIESETFFLEKVKLKNMRISQNAQCNCAQAEGIYVDGTDKTAKGIYSIAFPTERKNELSRRFIPFSAEMVRQIKKGFFETEETVKNAVQLQQVIYTDSGSFAILRLNAGVQQSFDTNGGSRQRTKTMNEKLKEHGGSGGGLNSFLPSAANRNNFIMNSIPGGGGTIQPLPPVGQTTFDLTSPIFQRSHDKRAPKFICFKLEKDDGFEWMQSRSLDVFWPAYNAYNYVNYTSGDKNELSAIVYQGDKADRPYPVFITMKNGSQFVQEIPQKKLWFSSMLPVGNKQYASLYYNYETLEGGLMIVSNQNGQQPNGLSAKAY